MRDFNKWLGQFRNSIADYKYYVDFCKVYGNIENIKVELNILNSLIGSKTIEKDFDELMPVYDVSSDEIQEYIKAKLLEDKQK